MIPIRDHNPTAGPVYVVWALVLTSVAAFFLPWAAGGDGALLAAAYRYGLVPAELWAEPVGRSPTLITYAFLHGGLLHLVGNLIFLWVFGDNVEDRLGHGRFLVFYLLGAAVAAAAHALVTADPSLPLIGASGAVSAVLGAYLRYYPHKAVQAVVLPLVMPWLMLRVLFRVRPFFLWTLPAWVYLVYWALVQLWEGLAGYGVMGGGIAWWAHVGGFAFGLLFAPAFARRH